MLTTIRRNNTLVANDNANPFVPTSIRDLLCDACGKAEATMFGMCPACVEDARAEAEERRQFRPEDER